MFGEKIFNFSEPISRKTVRIVLLVSFLAYQGMRLLWKQLRLKKWCKAISLLPSSLHYATSLQTLKSLSITCMRWLMVSCVHDPLLGGSSKSRERLSMK